MDVHQSAISDTWFLYANTPKSALALEDKKPTPPPSAPALEYLDEAIMKFKNTTENIKKTIMSIHALNVPKPKQVYTEMVTKALGAVKNVEKDVLPCLEEVQLKRGTDKSSKDTIII